MSRQFLSKKSVADFFDTSTSTVTRWVETGVLPAPLRIGGLDRWDVDTLMRCAVGAMSAQAGVKTAEAQADQALEVWRNERARDKAAPRGRHA